MASEQQENERKYEADQGTVLPLLDGLPGVAGEAPPAEQILEAEYYDTPDLRLLRAGITLRRRTGGTDAGWTLKLPAAAGVRTEIGLPLGSGGRRVPAELSGLVRVHARGRALRQVAKIDTRRRLRVLLGADGGSLAEIADDEVTGQSMGSETALTQWREIEVELTGGPPGLLAAADRRLREEGLRPAGQAAKLERALETELAALPAAQARASRPLTRKPAAGEVLLGYLTAQVAALQDNDPLVRRDVPDSVHQMRVATRRLRGTLKAFRDVLPREATDPVRGELKWLGGVLGEARDAEVLAERLRGHAHELPAAEVLGPVQARFQAHFAAVSAKGRSEVLKALSGRRYYALLDQLDELLADPPLTEVAGQRATKVLPAAVAKRRRRLRKQLQRAWRTEAGPARETALHEARKTAKDTRYAAEAASPAAGPQAAKFAKRMKKITSTLGDHHDAVVARGVLRELGVQAHLAGENAFSYGLLYQRERDELAPAEARARRAWKRSKKAAARDWLG